MIYHDNFDVALPMLSPQMQTYKSMSDKYEVMDTEKLVRLLLGLKTKNGIAVFKLREVRTSKSKNGSRGAHFAKLRVNWSYEINGDIIYPEVIIQNSHDGSCPFKIEFGLFRQVCSNGLCVKMKDLNNLSIRHVGTPEQVVFDLVTKMADELPKVVNATQTMSTLYLPDSKIKQFAKRVASTRWKDVTDADVEELLKPTRPEDEALDFWTRLNVLQEKIVNGGLKLENTKRKARAITRGQVDLLINSNIWEIANEYIDYEMVEN